jgi:hypothetical protein
VNDEDGFMKMATTIQLCAIALGFFLAASNVAYAHSGLVDGYGCHTDPKTGRYHCHQGKFVGQSFKSKEEFLKKLRSGSSALPSPKQTRSEPGKETK